MEVGRPTCTCALHADLSSMMVVHMYGIRWRVGSRRRLRKALLPCRRQRRHRLFSTRPSRPVLAAARPCPVPPHTPTLCYITSSRADGRGGRSTPRVPPKHGVGRGSVR